MPQSSDTLYVEGQIRLETGEGVHGLTVELLDTKLEYAERLRPTLTAVDGHFTFAFTQAEFADLFEAHRQVFLRLRDRWGNIIYTDQQSFVWEPGRRIVDLSLAPSVLTEHLRVPTTWKPVNGPLLPPERLADIDAAIALLIPPREPGHNRYLRAARCPLPEILQFETLLEDASDVLTGNITALERFTSALDLIDGQQSHNDTNGVTVHRGLYETA